MKTDLSKVHCPCGCGYRAHPRLEQLALYMMGCLPTVMPPISHGALCLPESRRRGYHDDDGFSDGLALSMGKPGTQGDTAAVVNTAYLCGAKTVKLRGSVLIVTLIPVH